MLVDYEHFQLSTDNGRVDILPSIGEMPFDLAWTNHVQIVVEGIPIRFISKADLIENKRQIGRFIDLADVEVPMRIPDVDSLRLPED